MTRTIALVNHKGGSTKTTSTVNLAQALVEAGYTVRVVDLDPQCNATTWLGATPEAVDNDVLSVLMMVASIEDATTITASGIHLVPATKELDSVGPYFLKKPGAHGVLRKALAGAPDVDFNLLDCPGDFDHLTISALVACTEVLAAVMTGAMELEALMRIENYITEQVELLNPTARLNHILCGRVELGQVIDQQVLAALRETYPDQTMRTIIPKSVRVSESYSAEEPVVRWAPSSSAARAYRDAARELVERDLR
ncbi:ParA family protein [Rhodococcus sp. ACPA1]|uniref:ParA family protein n=1 Tax=Rhodococcus sp. ACPA1 TaxID=2028572 RepID=UPI000BB115BA|nr:ParA family protein [Rhodococcus sp. ACPA1]PBC45298.1 chromosome partitioning protein ParA [Rhodococcus sp. ACPA1]